MAGALAALLVLAVVVVAVGLTVGTLLTLRRQRDRFAAANEVVPGVPTPAPASWAGSHDPEARLHRRLRDAVAALRATPATLDGSGLELRVELEQQALALDEALVAVSKAPVDHREAGRARVAEAVERLEATVADVGVAAADRAAAGLEAALDRARSHRLTLEEVRAELDRPPSLPRLDPDPSERPDPPHP